MMNIFGNTRADRTAIQACGVRGEAATLKKNHQALGPCMGLVNLKNVKDQLAGLGG